MVSIRITPRHALILYFLYNSGSVNASKIYKRFDANTRDLKSLEKKMLIEITEKEGLKWVSLTKLGKQLVKSNLERMEELYDQYQAEGIEAIPKQVFMQFPLRAAHA